LLTPISLSLLAGMTNPALYHGTVRFWLTRSLWQAHPGGQSPWLHFATLARQQPDAQTAAMSGESLDCLKCPAFCCRTAGYVEVSRNDIRRLAKFLNLTVRDFEERHIVERNRKGSKRIKSGFGTCQFLGENRRCTVYEARPKDCRGYVCWNQEDTTVYEHARFFQTAVAELRKDDPDGKPR